jgi:hypothetical protein
MAHPDIVLRLALACMVQDAESGLTPAQVAWIQTRLQSQAALAPRERARVYATVLRWATARYPTCVPILARQQEDG